MATEHEVREAVRSRYAALARDTEACCTSSDPISIKLYTAAEIEGLPLDTVAGSLGCGNPTALAELRPGEVVLDLGSGAGLDVLLAARQVAPDGLAYGLDMTDEMLERARANQEATGIANARFLKGFLEEIPLPDASVDVIISNCVINLAADKGLVLAEAFRVLRPGGRVAISDIVVHGEVPEAIRRDMEAWAGCIAGALEAREYEEKLSKAGFVDVSIETTRTYGLEEVNGRESWASLQAIEEEQRADVVSRFTSSMVRARRPA